MAHIRIGISGWRYAGWRGVFYPAKLGQAHELEFASREVQSIEINGSYYSLQSPKSYAHWYDATPKGFVFSLKGPRFLTHVLRFRGERANVALANFFASGLFNLREKLGPILWQFPPNFKFDSASFEAILQSLPANTDEAAELAARHDKHVKEVCLSAGRKRRLRHAIEIRNPSFCEEAFIKLLRKYRVALVVSDSVEDWPYAEDMTSDFAYLRLHGTKTRYGGKYSDAALNQWAKRIGKWAKGNEPDDVHRISSKPARQRAGRDVYCYFDNDDKVQAPSDARRLIQCIYKTGGLTLM
ncbi:DUF72 domain-containing protein [Alcaligenaceae bacterium]|nr:DUF72 domain-containing protein [Alcaligenaceae bacterium]